RRQNPDACVVSEASELQRFAPRPATKTATGGFRSPLRVHYCSDVKVSVHPVRNFEQRVRRRSVLAAALAQRQRVGPSVAQATELPGEYRAYQRTVFDWTFELALSVPALVYARTAK